MGPAPGDGGGSNSHQKEKVREVQLSPNGPGASDWGSLWGLQPCSLQTPILSTEGVVVPVDTQRILPTSQALALGVLPGHTPACRRLTQRKDADPGLASDKGPL